MTQITLSLIFYFILTVILPTVAQIIIFAAIVKYIKNRKRKKRLNALQIQYYEAKRKREEALRNGTIWIG